MEKIKDLAKKVDDVHTENVKAVAELKDRVRIIDATKYNTTDELQTAIGEMIVQGYELKNTINSLLIFVRIIG